MEKLSDDFPGTVRLWSLGDDALVEEGPGPSSLTVVSRWGETVLTDVDALTGEALRRMSFGPVSLGNAMGTDGGQRDGTPERVAALAAVLDRLGGVVVHSLGLHDGPRPILSAIPAVAAPDFRPTAVPATRAARLSRFATMRPRDGVLLLESPHAQFRVRLSEPAAVRIASALAAPIGIGELAIECRIPAPVVADVVAFLVAAGAVVLDEVSRRFAEDDDPVLRAWTHHELTFHVNTRTRRVEDGDGGAPAPRPDDQPVVKPLPAGQRFPLYRPQLSTMAAGDPSLSRLLETDHTCPDITDTELKAEQLGELLFRSARVRSTGPAHLPGATTSHDASQRPYFSTGCLYELELYLTLDRCAGLPRGAYHYDPLDHQLTLIEDDPARTATLLDIGKVAAGSKRRPAALITMTARIQRVSWLLRGAAYSTALLHGGALQQVLYLNAAAMGLSVHAVPVDASDAVDRLLGLNWPAEVGIGECVLGSDS